MAPGFPVRHWDQGGYAMIALLVAMSIMGVMLSVALPAWHTAARREKEAELVFRGEQYARAIRLFQRKYTNMSPPSVDVLLSERVLRKRYKDPITGGDFEFLTPGSAVEGTSTPPGMQGGSTQGRSTSSGSQTGSGSTGSSTSALTAFMGSRGGTATGRGTAAQPSGTASTSLTGRGGLQTQLTQGGATGGIMGVRSKSTEKSLRIYRGAEHYNEWIFQNIQTGRVGGAGTQAPGGGAGRGQPTPGGSRGTTTQSPSPFGRGIAPPGGGGGTRGRGF